MNLFRIAIKISSMLACLLMLAGCRETTTTTRIHTDGSCERIVEVRTDSSSVEAVFSETFPTPVDSTWTFEQTKDTANTEGGRFIYTARKRFDRVSDMDQMLKSVSDTAYHVEIDARLGKRFRWFNTFFEYRETYKACTPFKTVPISEFLNPEELALHYIKDDTLGLDKKVDQWILKNYFEELFAVLLRLAETMPLSGLSSDVFKSGKDSLFAAVQRLDQKKSKALESAQELIEFLEMHYRSAAIRRWSVPLEQFIIDVDKKQGFMINLDGNSYVNRVSMPGIILDSNASTIEGNTAVWNVQAKRFFWEDYSMRVESRVVNRWAMWATGGLLLVMAGLGFVLIRK